MNESWMAGHKTPVINQRVIYKTLTRVLFKQKIIGKACELFFLKCPWFPDLHLQRRIQRRWLFRARLPWWARLLQQRRMFGRALLWKRTWPVRHRIDCQKTYHSASLHQLSKRMDWKRLRNKMCEWNSGEWCVLL